MIRIALFSEDRQLQQLLSSALGKEFQVILEPDEEGIHRMFSAGACDVVVLDLDTNHGSLQERIACSKRIVASNISPVVLADDGLRSTALDLIRHGAHSYCRKPPSIVELKIILRRAYESRSLKLKLEAVQQQLEAVSSCDRMIGSSPQIREVYDLVRRVANVSTSVLVTGESGTGKELTARAIHNLGNRSGQPFVAVSCGAIPETLIEAELFGHEKGAFTGTVGLRQGYLEQAGGGTLFLDEIGELSLSTQVKLLRVLQEREFSRLGSSRLIPLRARLVFATHQDLSEMVASGTFRQDLYYRINVMKIDVPPLQDHPEDIPLIARHFLKRYSEMDGKNIDEIDPYAMCLLQAYCWPGNARELENVIQRAIIVARDNTIRAEDLPPEIQEERVINIEDYRSGGSFERQLRDYKIKLVTTAVRDSQGNKTLAASSLQISRAYLHRLIRLSEDGDFHERRIQQVGTA
jgi:DNA-binding NtrC family response regulator